VWACYVGHGLFGILQKPAWLAFYRPFGIPEALALPTMPLIGLVDITMGYLALLRPTRLVLLYTACWGIFTASLRPLVGMSVFETLERAGNYGPSIALLIGSTSAMLLAQATIADLSIPRTYRLIKTVLVLTTFLLLFAHGALAMSGKPALVEHWSSIGVVEVDETGRRFTRLVGAGEMGAALLLLPWPTRALCLLIVGWKLATEMLFLAAGDPVWEVLERGGSYGAPLALFLLLQYGSRARQREPALRAPRSGVSDLVEARP
jgi:hypothetical protein